MSRPRSAMEDGISFSQLRQLYLPDIKTDRKYSKDNREITYLDDRSFPAVRNLHLAEQKRILVTGGCGFVGSHLVDRLMLIGHQVICLDNFQTGHKTNVAHWYHPSRWTHERIGHPHFELIRHDVVDGIMVEVDQIYHLACPASPPQYQSNPIKTVKTSFLGTYNMLGLAKRCRARFLLASTSGNLSYTLIPEIYGDPEKHPQTESYWGNVNPIGPRSCYDEGKRIAETLTYEYLRQGHVATRVARIFNTYGPRQSIHDGRVVSNFITQALKGRELEIYGDGSQTRSFCFVDDLIGGLIKLMESDCTEPVNLGNPDEFTVLEFADMVLEIVGSKDAETSRIVIKKGLVDDPRRRKPDITKAKEALGWQPKWNVRKGLQETVEYFRALEKVAPQEI